MKLFKKRQKVGETVPMEELSLDDFIKIKTKKCDCNKSYIMKMSLCHIEKLPRYYDEFKYVCINCKWESPRFRTRTI